MTLANQVSIRSLRMHDIDDICNLHSSILPLHYPPAYFRQCLFHPHKRLCLVAETSNTRSIVAFITASLPEPQSPVHEFHILTLGVAPSHRRLGLGTRLFHAALSRAQEVSVRRPQVSSPALAKLVAHAAVSNMQACQFYRKTLGPQMEEERVDGLYRKSIMPSKDAYKFVGYIPLGNKLAAACG
jgi:ribosomal protein S18 acetylase RimI-like enzyme